MNEDDEGDEEEEATDPTHPKITQTHPVVPETLASPGDLSCYVTLPVRTPVRDACPAPFPRVGDGDPPFGSLAREPLTGSLQGE